MKIAVVAAAVLPHPPAAVFDVASDAERFPLAFRGFGPIPAITRIALAHGATQLAVGVERDGYGSDGSVLRERITRLERPHYYEYELTGGLARPLALLVRGAAIRWRFQPEDGGTRVTWRFEWTLTSPLAAVPALLLRVFLRAAMRRCLARISQLAAP